MNLTIHLVILDAQWYFSIQVYISIHIQYTHTNIYILYMQILPPPTISNGAENDFHHKAQQLSYCPETYPETGHCTTTALLQSHFRKHHHFLNLHLVRLYWCTIKKVCWKNHWLQSSIPSVTILKQWTWLLNLFRHLPPWLLFIPKNYRPENAILK